LVLYNICSTIGVNMAIVWTKYWAGSDDGTVLRGIDLRNIQDDLSVVQTVDDVLTIPGQMQGDVLYFSGTTWVRLGAGTSGQVLKTQGPVANPIWGDPTDLSITSQTTGDILYFNGTDWVRLAPGAAGTVLTSNGSGVAPSFQTVPTLNRQTFTSNGTFTAPTGITKVYLTLVGGGGSGGNANTSTTGAGGGGGGTIIRFPYTVVPSSNYAVVVGIGGTLGVNPAGVSSFDGTVVAPYGVNGDSDGDGTPIAYGGRGGHPDGGGYTGFGHSNDWNGGYACIEGGRGYDAIGVNGGGGGGTMFGVGADGASAYGNGNAAAANTGAGGGGAHGVGGVGRTGGAGGSGLVIVEY
jgi:hypothetical protein